MHDFLSDDEAKQITDHFNKYKEARKKEYKRNYEYDISHYHKRYEMNISAHKTQILRLRDEVAELKEKINTLENDDTSPKKMSAIVEFIKSDEVKGNYKWLCEPNCKNRDFNAGFQSVIEKIENIIENTNVQDNEPIDYNKTIGGKINFSPL